MAALHAGSILYTIHPFIASMHTKICMHQSSAGLGTRLTERWLTERWSNDLW